MLPPLLLLLLLNVMVMSPASLASPHPLSQSDVVRPRWPKRHAVLPVISRLCPSLASLRRTSALIFTRVSDVDFRHFDLKTVMQVSYNGKPVSNLCETALAIHRTIRHYADAFCHLQEYADLKLFYYYIHIFPISILQHTQ